MKQLHKQISANYAKRDDELQTPSVQSPSPYSSKTQKGPRSLPRSINYLLKEQRLLFILVGILIASTFFILQPTLTNLVPADSHPVIHVEIAKSENFRHGNGRRIPPGVRKLPLRIVITGGDGFVGRWKAARKRGEEGRRRGRVFQAKDFSFAPKEKTFQAGRMGKTTSRDGQLDLEHWRCTSCSGSGGDAAAVWSAGGGGRRGKKFRSRGEDDLHRWAAGFGEMQQLFRFGWRCRMQEVEGEMERWRSGSRLER